MLVYDSTSCLRSRCLIDSFGLFTFDVHIGFFSSNAALSNTVKGE